MDSAAVNRQLTEELPGWQLCLDESAISKTYATTGWKSSLLIANAIGLLAEAGWHHPQIVINFSSVIINLTTHSEGGITGKDFALAKKIDELIEWVPDDNVLQPPPVKHAMLKY